jgi:hypothetical protein
MPESRTVAVVWPTYRGNNSQEATVSPVVSGPTCWLWVFPDQTPLHLCAYKRSWRSLTVQVHGKCLLNNIL